MATIAVGAPPAPPAPPPYPSAVSPRLNCETSRRRWVRIRTPSVRAASTKPAAAIVLPEAVGWRKR